VMKPTIFCGVPRVYDRIYTGVMQTSIMVINSNHIFRFIIILESCELKVSTRKFSLED
jgi:long-subunit acyl-CoA synthetase (AMP-forming)